MPFQENAMSDMSSSPISSAPNSPPNNHRNGFSDTIHVARHHHTVPGFGLGDGVVRPLSATPAAPAIAQHTAHGDTTSKSGIASAPEKPKRQRKKKEVGPDGKPIADDKPKEKKPRKPRDPNKPVVPRKRQKTGEATEKITQNAPTASTTQSRQPTISDMMGGQNHQSPAPTPSTAPASHPYHPPSESMVRSSVPPHLSNPATPRPSSSGQNYDPIRGSAGQNYDPIRGSTVESSRPPPSHVVPSNGPPATHPSPHAGRTSASPSIASLVNPPPTAIKTAAPPAYPQQTFPQPSIVPSQQQSPPPKTTNSFAPLPPQTSPPISKPIPSTMDGAMDLDAPQCDNAFSRPPEVKKAPSKSSSSAPTPKETSKAPAMPKASGTGLLSSTNLFGGPSSSEGTERKNVDIEIVIPLNPRGGNTINIAQEIIKKYGQDAINPRAAAHRAQLLRLAAQQSKMEGNTTDDMSVDLMSDMEGDSNVEMGGMDSGADAAEKPKRKRRAKQEEYDKEDDFIDDTELAWQEQAAVAKDGFFVYSGPLVPDGQSAQVESSAPARGGRGRGRGRGSRGGTTSGATHASLAEKKTEGTTARGGKGSRGGRGTGVTRKPRMTKADRERMEADKVERERTAGMLAQGGTQMSLGPTPTPGPSAQMLTSSMHAQGYPQMAGNAAS